MWPFSLLKKFSQDPPVGQTRGDYIGCYLLGTQTTGKDEVSYISLATSEEALERDAREYLQGFLQQHPQLAAAERDALEDLMARWRDSAAAHLAAGTHRPLAVQGGIELFLRTGMRARKKEKGVYLE